MIERSSLESVRQSIQVMKLKHSVPQSNIIVDEIGVGAGIVDQLSCKGFVASAAAIKRPKEVRKFANLRSQCYFYLSDKVNNAELYNSQEQFKEQIIEELAVVKTKSLEDDSVSAIISKEDMKKFLGGKSPDFADALMMRSYFDLTPSYGFEV